jgi:NADPH:quinone reductase
MRRAIVRELGPPEIIAIEEAPSRPPGPEEARVRIRAGGLNFPDMLMAAGKYQLKPPLPFTPGMEAAGDVVEVGGALKGFKPGDRVIVKLRHGAFSEEVTVGAAHLLPLPAGMDYAEGATLLAAYGTAYHALVERQQLKSGEVLLVHGAAGGVGLAAVDLGKRLGATVIATGSRDDKLAVVKARGADHVVNYVTGNFRDRVLELTGGRGADVIYDPVGGSVFEQSLRCIAWNGRLLVVGFAGGTIAKLKTNLALLKGCSVLGLRAGEATRQDPTLGPRRMAVLLDWGAKGWIRPHISHRFPLEQIAAAMRVLDRREAIGRVALEL